MTEPDIADPRTEQLCRPVPLRLWPGVLIVALQWLGRFVVPLFEPEALGYGVMAGLLGGLAILVWWVFFSRAPRFERVGAILLMIAAVAATQYASHESIATGMMGLMLTIYSVPVLSLVLVVWALLTRGMSAGPRRATMLASILLSCGPWTLVRTGGFTGDFDHDFAWRWSETPEDQLLRESADEPMAPPPTTTAAATEARWPGFRGTFRDATLRGVKIATDWSVSPPVELWHRPIGPGWSSFAVGGELLYTQEQRGEDEVVACYRVSSGQPVWRHRDRARFWESTGGAGPRATPTLHDGRVYAFGGTGILNALDAGDGALVWSRNAASDVEAEIPEWGFASSPLVVGDIVVVAVPGRLAAYDLATGKPRWVGPDGGGGYSSPHRLTIDGVEQILLMSQAGATSVGPVDGELIWQYAWPGGSRIVQPALTRDGDLLLSKGDRGGMRRISVAHGPGKWAIEERWTTIRLKPYYSDIVIHRAHAFGFDGSMLACIDLTDGKRKWKGGRYGAGQVMLLADQDLLLVLSERGELVLVEASLDRFKELARLPAIEGKTWNHAVLAGDVLLVRNAQEMAAFRLTLAGD